MSIDATLPDGMYGPLSPGEPPLVVDKWDAAELGDLLGRHHCQRPVIFESVSRYVVWVDEDLDTETLDRDGCNYEYIESGAHAFEGYIRVSDPDRWNWGDEIADGLNEYSFNDFGPQDAPLQGPEWGCAHCPRRQDVLMAQSGYWPRGHDERCPNYVASAVAA